MSRYSQSAGGIPEDRNSSDCGSDTTESSLDAGLDTAVCIIDILILDMVRRNIRMLVAVLVM